MMLSEPEGSGMMEVRRLTFLLKLSCIRLFWEGKGRLERGESGGLREVRRADFCIPADPGDDMKM